MVTTEFLPIGLLTSIAHDLRVSEGTAGLMVTMPGLLAAFIAPLSTLFIGTVNRRTLLMILMALIGVANLVTASASNFGSILIGRLILGACIGVYWTFAPAMGVQLVAQRHAGRAAAIILAGISVGTVLGVPAGAALGNLTGWRTAFVAAGGVAVLVLTAQAALLSSLPGSGNTLVRDLLGLLSVSRARLGLVVIALVFAGQFAAYTYLEPLLRDSAHITAQTLSGLLAAYGIAGLFGTFLGERGVAKDVRIALPVAVAALSGSILLVALLSVLPVGIAIAVVLWGAGFGAIPVCGQMWMYQAAPVSFEKSMALMVTTSQIAVAAGSVLGGIAVDRSGIFSAYYAGAAMCALALVLLLGNLARGRGV
ncbi:MFS transporter [Paraburkholderia largidicola]|uniref:MFS transporter n=1 Tax=Paraburkholderia largidicola TaxID=3014751 RepID=A0A7I8C3I9_9BURK|nr:MFS transporter [Paraburkholderia sp. PGU16]BCF95061.1 MFS transporter [Paraburkholderia sp. PGU16]